MENGRISDNVITASSSKQGFEAPKARLNHQSAWCPKLNSTHYLQVNLNSTYVICAIGTQGNQSASIDAFVQEYKIELSINGTKWDFYRVSDGIMVCFKVRKF